MKQNRYGIQKQGDKTKKSRNKNLGNSGTKTNESGSPAVAKRNLNGTNPADLGYLNDSINTRDEDYYGDNGGGRN